MRKFKSEEVTINVTTKSFTSAYEKLLAKIKNPLNCLVSIHFKHGTQLVDNKTIAYYGWDRILELRKLNIPYPNDLFFKELVKHTETRSGVYAKETFNSYRNYVIEFDPANNKETDIMQSIFKTVDNTWKKYLETENGQSLNANHPEFLEWTISLSIDIYPSIVDKIHSDYYTDRYHFNDVIVPSYLYGTSVSENVKVGKLTLIHTLIFDEDGKMTSDYGKYNGLQIDDIITSNFGKYHNMKLILVKIPSVGKFHECDYYFIPGEQYPLWNKAMNNGRFFISKFMPTHIVAYLDSLK